MLTRTAIAILGISTFFVALPAIVRLDCGTAAQSSDHNAPLQVIGVTIADTVSADEGASFKATLRVPNPCWRFDHFEISANENEKEITVTAYGAYDGRPCQQMLSTIAATDTLAFSGPGIYVLKFWRSAQETMNKTVVAK